ncbi:MAG: 3-ketoacyl-ACP reductase [Acidobacteria bacterium]|nr:3-ketoacyl-ACP reductase [Acidobacteriota bacterium]
MAQLPVALVTGAARGIGRSVARELAREGYHIAAVAPALAGDGERPGLAALCAEIEGLGGRCLPLAADVADPDTHVTLVQAVMDHLGRIDILVCRAEPDASPGRDILAAEPDTFDAVLAAGLRGPFFLGRRVATQMVADMHRLDDYRPMMVFITSIAARASSTDRPEYCISQAGLSMAAQVFAHRLAGEGVAVYEVRPGIIAAEMPAPERTMYDRLMADGRVPQLRWGEPRDVARCVRALARGDLAYATGSVLELSGGMQIRRL